MFAKRHYEAIALAMQAAHPDCKPIVRKGNRDDSQTALAQWDFARRELAAMFKADSRRFDEARFVVACLPGNNVRARTQHLRRAS